MFHHDSRSSNVEELAANLAIELARIAGTGVYDDEERLRKWMFWRDGMIRMKSFVIRTMEEKERPQIMFDSSVRLT